MGAIQEPADTRLQRLFITALVKHAAVMQGRAGAHAISLSCWALGKERIPFGQARVPIMGAIKRSVPYMTSQDVSNTLWGFAQCGEPLGETVVPLLTQLLHVLEHEPVGADDRAPQQLSVSVEVYGELHAQGKAAGENQHLQGGLIAAVQSVCAACTDQELAGCVLGFGKLGWKHGAAQEVILAALGQKTLQRESTFTDRHVAHIINGFEQSEQELPEHILVALLEHLVQLPPEEVPPHSVSQVVVSYGIMHSTGKAAAVSERLQQGLGFCVSQKALSLSSRELVLCVVGLGKLQWGFGAALGPLQEAAAAAAGSDSAGLALRDIQTLRNAFSSVGEPLGVAAGAFQRRQDQLQKGNRNVLAKVQ